ncbi:IclR family transcriptional regulator [Pseudorhodoferax sp. Leaf267]|uniref:IclR family transcriptional regulator n=1 Tax=Pseudorhodoferax sp. Leaf267 TaxID=1736316 RepID=UPI0006F95B30|nr:IclR family transcriptional regulator [Pseudorhodoferax sp. Leaf267]KQP12662.1 IclR family transcriptional regulator [Pseudorhodoferax sp. Leaf267]
MSSPLERSLSILEYLAARPEGMTLSTIASDLELPLSACHRLLTELVRCGYVRQMRDHGDYALTTKLASLGLSYLGGSGIVDIAQPVIDRLADVSGELVRLAIVDGDRLTFVAKAQGAKFGLRYDPDMGIDVRLSCSAGGHAWLMTLDDERALELVVKQGFGDPRDYGPRAPTGWKAVVELLEQDRARGFSMIHEMYAPGMSALAAPVRRRGEPTIGVITIAGPAIRLTEERMLELGAPLLSACGELAMASTASPIFARRSAPAAAPADPLPAA